MPTAATLSLDAVIAEGAFSLHQMSKDQLLRRTICLLAQTDREVMGIHLDWHLIAYL